MGGVAAEFGAAELAIAQEPPQQALGISGALAQTAAAAKHRRRQWESV